jgi:hypothetical protein
LTDALASRQKLLVETQRKLSQAQKQQAAPAAKP